MSEINMGKQLVTAMRDLHRSWMDVSPKGKLNKSQYFELGAIKFFKDEHPGAVGATVKDLAQKSGRSPASISQKISALEEQGLVYRTPDKSDKRIVYFNVTEEGERIHEEIHSQMRNFTRKVIEKFGEEQTMDVIKLMRALTDTIVQANLEMQAEHKDEENS